MATTSAPAPRPPVQATGRVVRDRDGLELLVQRRLPVSKGDAWKWMTASSQLKKWLGSWKGSPAVGAVVAFTMTFEKGAGPEPVTILECIPEQRLLVEWTVGADLTRVGFSLAEIDGSTIVYFSQRVEDYRQAGNWGPGWEYYLDRLVAVQSGGTMPEFSDYHPAQQPYFERLALDGDPDNWQLR